MLLVFMATTAFAQLRDNPGPGNNDPSLPATSNDFYITSFTFDGGTTVTRETMVNATIVLKNKGGAAKNVMLDFLPDASAQKGASINTIPSRGIDFNSNGESTVHLSFNGYPDAKTYQSKVIVNPTSSPAETSYSNNEKQLAVTVNPHKVEIDVTFEQVTIIHDLDVGEGEFRMNMKVGKKNKDGVVTWVTPTQWFPSETGYRQVDDAATVPNYQVAMFIKIKDVSEEDYIVYETNAVEDDVNYNDNMGKCTGQFPQIKAWTRLDKASLNTASAGKDDVYNVKSDLHNYSVYVTAKVISVN